jgi:hypothetical protein
MKSQRDLELEQLGDDADLFIERMAQLFDDDEMRHASQPYADRWKNRRNDQEPRYQGQVAIDGSDALAVRDAEDAGMRAAQAEDDAEYDALLAERRRRGWRR